jgi:K+-sensing histidine kinase KdpD
MSRVSTVEVLHPPGAVHSAKMMVSEDQDKQVQVRTLKKSAKRVAVSSVAVALLTLVSYRAHLDFASAIPLYMLVIVLHSLTGDFWSSAVISVLSAGCLDFFLPILCSRCVLKIRPIVLHWWRSWLQPW